jgi:hypothetical protein
MEFIRVYKKISSLEEEVEKLRGQLDGLRSNQNLTPGDEP